MEKIIKIANVRVEPPENFRDTVIDISFDANTSNIFIGSITRDGNVENYQWVRENCDVLLAHHKEGRSYIGLPLEVGISKFGQYDILFNGFLDFTQNPTLSKRRCSLPGKELHGAEWLRAKFDSKYFANLVEEGLITEDMYYFMPYVKYDPDASIKIIITIFSTVSIVLQIQAQIDELRELFAHASSPFSWGAIVAIVVRLLALTVLLITLYNLILTLKELILEPVKYHAVMRRIDLLTAAFASFGYTLEAPIFDEEPFNNEFVLAEKYNIPSYSFDTGLFAGVVQVLGGRDTKDLIAYPDLKTIGRFIQESLDMYCSKILITPDKKALFLRRDQNLGTPQYQMSDVFNDGEFSFNGPDLKSTFLVQFLTDARDRNTLLNYKGTIYQVSTELVEDVPIEYNLLNGLQEFSIAYARATRKDSLTTCETIIREFFEIVQPLINLLIDVIANPGIDVANVALDFARTVADVIDTIDFGATDLADQIPGPISTLDHVDFAGDIDNRIGMLSIESDFVSVQKSFIMIPSSDSKFNKIHPDNDTLISAKNFWEKFFGPAYSFVPSVDRPNGNQYIIQKFTKVPFEKVDYDKVKYNNSMFMADGRSAQLVSSRWKLWDLHAEHLVRISQIWLPADRIIETFTEPEGR